MSFPRFFALITSSSNLIRWIGLSIYILEKIEQHIKRAGINPGVKSCIISSYEEAVGLFLENFRKEEGYQNFEKMFDKKCTCLLKQLYAEIYKYEPNAERLIKYCPEEALLKDQNWLAVVALAQNSYEALELYIKEVENAT